MKYVQVGLGQRWGGLRRILDQYPGFERQATVLLNGRMARDGIYTDLAACLADQRADVVISFASPLATPGLAKTALDCGVPIMVTAPPAATTAGLDELGEFADTNQVQVYQPYVRLPGHLARLAALKIGHLGAVSEVQIGLDDPAHAIALMRAYLWAASDAAEGRRAVVSGHYFPNEDLDGTDGGPQSLIAIDFGEGKRGIYLGEGTKSHPGRLLIKAS
ncbi:MAG: hypothetical protein LBE83_08410, partial [Propionibacteriaceae bacterium]|nr:hypothetical protein [Propionibacteriaceae bacterium]